MNSVMAEVYFVFSQILTLRRTPIVLRGTPLQTEAFVDTEFFEQVRKNVRTGF